MSRSPRKRGKRSGGDAPGSAGIVRSARTPSTYGAPQAHAPRSNDPGVRRSEEEGPKITIAEEPVIVTKVIAAIRVSTYEQGLKGASLPEQKEVIARHCQFKGLPAPVPIDEVHDSNAAPSVLFTAVESATERATPQREVWKRALSLARPGAIFIVTKLDRFSRSVLSGLNALNHLEANGTKLVSLAENIDTSTPIGRAMYTMLLASYELEERNIFARTSGGRRLRRREGNWTEGPVPLGFARGMRVGSRAGPLVINTDEDHIIVEIYTLRDKGVTCWRIARIMREKHPELRRWSAGMIAKILRSRVYIGEMRAEARTGDWIVAHPAIVPRDLFFRVQAKLDAARSPGRPPDTANRFADWFLHGLMTCGLCGATVKSAEYHQSKSSMSRLPRRTTHTGYYACYRHFSTRGASGSGPRCRIDAWPFLRNNEVHDRASLVIAQRIENLRELWANPAVTTGPRAQERDFRALRKKITARLERIASGYSKRLYGARMAAKLNQEALDDLAKLEAEERLLQAERDAIDPALVHRSVLEAIPAMRELWEVGEPSEHRDVTEWLTEKIELFPNGNLEFTWREPGELVKKLGFLGGGGLSAELTTNSGVSSQFGYKPDPLEIIRKSVASSLSNK